MGAVIKEHAELLDELYDSAMEVERWPRFLGRLADAFECRTAAFRVIDGSTPQVLHSITIGFDPCADRQYVDAPAVDLFHERLNRAPLGQIQASHRLIDDRAFELSEHYQRVFRPNGNFYAMGAQVDRHAGRAVHVGVHRPRAAGPFEAHEMEALESFSPHLRRAACLMRRLGELQDSLDQARAAVDRLPFAVWMLDDGLDCRWMNTAATAAVRDGLHGIGVRGTRLALREPAAAAALRAGRAALQRRQSRVARVRLGLSGACLLLVDPRESEACTRLDADGGLLVFLLDPARAVELDTEGLRQLYRFTPAEQRLVEQLMAGLDVGEACAAQGISAHTGRSHMKSVLRKTDCSRQAELMRKLLLGSCTLRAPATDAARAGADRLAS